MKKYFLFAILAIILLGIVSCNKEKEKTTPLYSVTFDLQGKGTAIDTVYVEEGSVIVEPSEPTDELFTFDGWFKDPETTKKWNFEVDKITGNMTLYAKWTSGKHCCIVTFVTEKTGAKVPNDTVDYASTVTQPKNPTTNDYHFDGWYKDNSFTTPWDFQKDVVTQKDTKIYAKWTKYSYYGAELYSKETFKYGRFEARMKMAYAPGCVSSMFLYYNNSDKGGGYVWNEIDIEVIGKEESGFQSNIITGKAGAQITSEEMHTMITSPQSEYHTYVIEWTPEYVSWTVDKIELRKTELGTTKQQVEAMTGAEEQSLRFNLWIPNTNIAWVGRFRSNKLPVMQYIDYVKVYNYNTDTKEFTEYWTDDFDSFNSSRWSKGDWQMDQSRESKDNVVVEDGNLVLKLTKKPND